VLLQNFQDVLRITLRQMLAQCQPHCIAFA
jgi:hypothetical protein